jgi:hypothetical protein
MLSHSHICRLKFFLNLFVVKMHNNAQLGSPGHAVVLQILGNKKVKRNALVACEELPHAFC